MLESLKFVRGSVAKKDFIPALTHFLIDNGAVRGFNGVLALSSPIPFDISCKPNAEALIKAIGNCETTVQMSLTPAGKLSIRSGKFRALVNCVEGETPHVEPEGERFEFNGDVFLTCLKVLEPLMGNDASRVWSNGILFCAQSAFAVNNIILAEYWLGTQFPTACCIPSSAIKEIVRINEPPLYGQITPNSVTFHFSGNRWIRTQLLDANAWPDVNKVLNKEAQPMPMDESLFPALAKLKPFCDGMGRIFFTPNGVCTHLDQEQGATVEIDNFIWKGVFNVEMLLKLEPIVKTIDWDMWPSPCLFFGDRLRGAIVGMRE